MSGHNNNVCLNVLKWKPSVVHYWCVLCFLVVHSTHWAYTTYIICFEGYWIERMGWIKQTILLCFEGTDIRFAIYCFSPQSVQIPLSFWDQGHRQPFWQNVYIVNDHQPSKPIISQPLISPPKLNWDIFINIICVLGLPGEDMHQAVAV